MPDAARAIAERGGTVAGSARVEAPARCVYKTRYDVLRRRYAHTQQQRVGML